MNHFRQRLLSFALLALAATGALGADNSERIDPGAGLFTNRTVHQIQITISPENVAALKNSPRQYVSATLRDGTNTFEKVAVHLKGSVGSFRGLDGKPAFTVSFDRFDSAQRFHGHRKIHLNNSVEDPSYMNELIGGEFFRAAGVPAARVTHAIVEFNGRRLGVYVLKEGFTEDFLALYFRNPTGNLYDTGAGRDVDQPLRKDLGANPEDRSDLDALVDAALDPDLGNRWSRLRRAVNMDRVLSFMAAEILLGHRDGYCQARNNFRVYHDVDSGRMLFFPHGMDVLFGNPRALVDLRMNGLVAQAIMEIPEGRRAYRTRCAQLFTNQFDVAKIHARIDDTLLYLRPALPRDEAAALDREAAALKARITARAEDLAKQLSKPPLELLRFTDGVASIGDWQPVDVPEGGTLSANGTLDGKRALAIHAGPVTSASWRTKVLLPPGRYRFEGAVKTSAIAPLKFGRNHGAGLRIAGPAIARSALLQGNQPWTQTQVFFNSSAREQEVELICELRASKGDAWFELESLRLVRVP
jgi:spore coat protein H